MINSFPKNGRLNSWLAEPDCKLPYHKESEQILPQLIFIGLFTHYRYKYFSGIA